MLEIHVKSMPGTLVAMQPILIGSPVAFSPVPIPHSPGFLDVRARSGSARRSCRCAARRVVAPPPRSRRPCGGAAAPRSSPEDDCRAARGEQGRAGAAAIRKQTLHVNPPSATAVHAPGDRTPPGPWSPSPAYGVLRARSHGTFVERR